MVTVSQVETTRSNLSKYLYRLSMYKIGAVVREIFVLFSSAEPPIFTNNLRQETLSEYNSVVKLSCEAIGIPTPNITWYRNAVDVSKITHHTRYSIEEGGTLVIKKLTMDDAGLFQCVATNEAGSDFLVTWLKVKGRKTRVAGSRVRAREICMYRFNVHCSWSV